jgi:KipI family sensor histidine kinase inhibitor
MIYPAGDCALTVEFGTAISPELNDQVHALARSLREKSPPGLCGMVPAYASLLVYFDPLRISSRRLAAVLRRRIRRLKKLRPAAAVSAVAGAQMGKTIRIPVCYEGDYAPDMEAVSAHTGFSPAEIIARHTKPVYRIYMLGFLPGFPYLGGLDPALETPRLAAPRTVIPAGSVGIGGAQTGIYPLESPGGWRLIGRTPLKPYDPGREEPFLYRAGDSIAFYAIHAKEYEDIARLQRTRGDPWD